MNQCSDEIAKPTNEGKLPKTKRNSEDETGRKSRCINEQDHFWKWRGNAELHLSAQDRARGSERDGTQHWLPNYAFYHFSHNRVPPFFSCPVYSCSCSTAALMREIKDNHNCVVFTSTDHQMTSYGSYYTHKHTICWSWESHIVTVPSSF